MTSKARARANIIQQMLNDSAVAQMSATSRSTVNAYNERDTFVAYAYARSAAHLANLIGPPWQTKDGKPT